jgi:three-Cys-motif partner protein
MCWQGSRFAEGAVPVWSLDRAPQTRAKLRILADYLKAWATIIKDYFEVAYYVDGFAGAGTYTLRGVRVCGSPGIAAMVGALASKAAGSKGDCFELRCRLTEVDASTCETLRTTCAEWPQQDIQIRCEAFSNALPGIAAELAAERNARRRRADRRARKVAALFFVDPFGIAGLSLDPLRGILAQPNTEALINLNVPSVRRHIGQVEQLGTDDPKRMHAARKLGELLGDADWRDAWRRPTPAQRELALVDLCKSRLGTRFVSAKRMDWLGGGTLMYYLVHATNNDIGAKIIGDIFEREEASGTLFGTQTEGCKASLRQRYGGRKVALSAIRTDMAEVKAKTLNRALGELLVGGHAAAPTWGLLEDEEYTFFGWNTQREHPPWVYEGPGPD